MIQLHKDLILKEIPLFSDLSGDELNIVREKSDIVEYKKGEIIYNEGASPNAFYCLILGRILIHRLNQYGNKMALEYLHRGKYFGIISLLTNEPHSVTAEAINDCLLLTINKEDFDFILLKIPRIAIDLSRTLSRRLKRKDVHEKTIFESTIISVFSSYSPAGKTIYALNLALSLLKETRKSVIILDISPSQRPHSLPKKLDIENLRVLDLSVESLETATLAKDSIAKCRFGIDIICFYYRQEDESSAKKLLSILSLLMNDYHYIILDLPSSMDKPVYSMLNQSDLIHILTSPEPQDLKSTYNLLGRLKEEFNFLEEKMKIIVNEYKFSQLTTEEETEILGKNIFATLPKIGSQTSDRIVLEEPDSEYAKTIRRIARYTGEMLVGLVLGVGVAYGFCHIGVLKVIEEENIPIDIIAGSSVGALIASLWVTGRTSDEILEITKEFKVPKHIWGLIDLTFPRSGFIKGNKLRRFLKRHLNNKTFYDARLPLKIIASDVKRKEPRVFDKGLLTDAIMASCSMPGVFTPFKFKEEMLFDGGIINPLPTEPLLKMGIRKIIAVNVTPSRDDILRQYNKIKEQLTETSSENSKERRLFSLGGRFKNIFQTNILDIIFSSVEILQSEVARNEAQLADVVLHPDTSGMYWLELHRAPEFAKRGEEEARSNLDKILQLVNE